MTRHDTTWQDTKRHGKTRHDMTRHYTRWQDTTRRDKTRHDQTRHKKTRHETTWQDITRQGMTRQDKSKHDKTKKHQIPYVESKITAVGFLVIHQLSQVSNRCNARAGHFLKCSSCWYHRLPLYRGCNHTSFCEILQQLTTCGVKSRIIMHDHTSGRFSRYIYI